MKSYNSLPGTKLSNEAFLDHRSSVARQVDFILNARMQVRFLIEGIAFGLFWVYKDLCEFLKSVIWCCITDTVFTH